MRQKGELVAEIAGVAMDLSAFDSFLTEWLTPVAGARSPGEEGNVNWEHWTLSAKRITLTEWKVYWNFWAGFLDEVREHVSAEKALALEAAGKAKGIEKRPTPMGYVTALPCKGELSIRCYNLNLRPTAKDVSTDGMAELMAEIEHSFS